MYRVLREEGLQHHRGRAKAPSSPKAPTTHCAFAPNEAWCWDITWLPGPIRGQFFFLYLILDLFSRKIVGWEVHDAERGEHASALVERTVWRERCVDKPMVLHGDNGSPLKGATVQTMLAKLGITASFSRPRVSNDNAYAESIFRTLKYAPAFPRNGFESLEAARNWVHGFSHWYNTQHRHRGINYVTPQQRGASQDSCRPWVFKRPSALRRLVARGSAKPALVDPSFSFLRTSAEGSGPGWPDKAHGAWPESLHPALRAAAAVSRS
jgi:transposase InsO family protein